MQSRRSGSLEGARGVAAPEARCGFASAWRPLMLDLNDAEDQRPDVPLHDADDLSHGLAATAHIWVPELFPNGRLSKDGKEWRCANIEGDAPTHEGSCVIHLKGPHAGCWYDHSTGRGGKPLSTLQMATGLRGRGLFEKAAEIIGATPARSKRKVNGHANGHDKRSNWQNEVAFAKQGSAPLAGTKGETYFKARGLNPPDCKDLLFREWLTDYSAMRARPGIVAIIRDPVTGKETGGILRIFLTDDCSAKADVPKPKMMLGPCDGVVMLNRMGEDGVLGIGEG